MDLVDNSNTSAILRAVIGLGEELGVSITAEGVETAEQMEELLAMGCNEGQGYPFGRPMPARDVPRLIEKTRQKTWLKGSARPETIEFGHGRRSVHSTPVQQPGAKAERSGQSAVAAPSGVGDHIARCGRLGRALSEERRPVHSPRK